MAYLALYREWRPRRFQDMVGQEHVTTTLRNALKQDKIAHAYLFSGPRGTGKTTAAKILAKALNCEAKDGVEPCGSCSSCVSIDQGSAMEVFEIDAASNRGIDEIRDLREKVKLSAGQGKFKVYIIDEVHMLTTEAFNALLKTLEEPPTRVIFILATTEAHKVPLTILSRVQRFEFRRIPEEDIRQRLAEVCHSLGREVEPGSLQVIAQKSEGGLRDALSILDQCLLQEGSLTIEQIYSVLGIAGEEYSSQLVAPLIVSDYGAVLFCLAQGIEQGRDPRVIMRELLDYLRQVLLYLSAGQMPVLPGKLQAVFTRQSKEIGLGRLLSWISVLLQGEGQLKFSANPRLAAEMLLVKTIYDGEERTGEAWPESADAKAVGASRGSHGEGRSADSQAGRRDQTSEALGKSPRVQAEGQSPKSRAGGNTSDIKSVTLAQIEGRWQEILERVRQQKKSTHAFLLEGKPEILEGEVLTLVFKDGFSFHRDKVNQPENRLTIEKALLDLFGVSLTLKNVLENEVASADKTQESEEEILIKKAEAIFGKDFVEVRQD